MSDEPVVTNVFGQLESDAFGRLVFVAPDGESHVGVVPVRAFPLSAPLEGLSLIDARGHEVAWVDRFDDLPALARSLIEAELASRELTPEIHRLLSVSTFSTPSTWYVLTDRGQTSFILKIEEDIRRLRDGRLVITSSHGLQLKISDAAALDRHSRRLLERFL